MTTANTDRDWNAKYRDADTPWDSGLASKELARVLRELNIVPSRAMELGCGTGTNAVFLAQQGFDVTAVDCSPLALNQARQKATDVGVAVEFILADVERFGAGMEPFDFVFDRGVYHCCRRVDLPGYIATLEHVTRPGTRYLSLAGNANEQTEHGPPRVTEAEIRAELGGLFEIDMLRAFHFEDAGGVRGPLGWSTLMTRKHS